MLNPAAGSLCGVQLQIDTGVGLAEVDNVDMMLQIVFRHRP